MINAKFGKISVQMLEKTVATPPLSLPHLKVAQERNCLARAEKRKEEEKKLILTEMLGRTPHFCTFALLHTDNGNGFIR